jgi:hypothetical protein
MRLFYLAVILLALRVPVLGQLAYDDIHVNFRFPTVVDGTDSGRTWRSAFILSNPGANSTTATLFFQDSAGDPLSLAIGTVQSSGFRVTLPPGSTRVYTTSGTGPYATGWAIVSATNPIAASVRLLEFEGTTLKAEIPFDQAPFVLAASSLVTGKTEVALVNAYNDGEIELFMSATNINGVRVASRSLSIPSFGRSAGTVESLLPDLPANFTGTFRVSGDEAYDFFSVAFSERDASGTLRALRGAKYINPGAQFDNVSLAFRRIITSAQRSFPDLDLDGIGLRLSYERAIDARALNGNEIRINYALAELINDSPGELAFIVGHQVGHILQQRGGALVFNEDPEVDADAWGALLALTAGYDPYGAAGALARLALVTSRPGVVRTFEGQPASELNRALMNRLGSLYDLLKSVCESSEDAQTSCDIYRYIVRPTVPASLPFSKPDAVRSISRQPRELRVPSTAVVDLP